MSATGSGPRRRADAERNRLAIVAAATEAFATGGLDVSMHEIATRAGVGKATVYRCFSTKDDLVAAIARERLQAWTTLATDALAAERPGDALRALLETMAARLANDQTAAVAVSGDVAEPSAEKAAAQQAIDRLVDRAREHGDVRDDITGHDVRVLFGGLARALMAEGERDPVVWVRYTGLIADAIGLRSTARR